MHIAQFTNTYHPMITGVVRSISDFRKALSELGHNVFIFAQNASKYQDKAPFVFRYPTIQVQLPGDFPAMLPVSPFVDWVLPSLKLDVIHTHHPVLLGQTAASKAKELKVPLVYTFHTQYQEYSHYFPIQQHDVQKWVKGAIQDWLAEYMQLCHHIIVPSKSIYQALEKQFGIEHGVTVLPTGIDLAPYENADGDAIRAKHGWENDKILISVGRLEPEKNWKTLIHACAIAMRNHSDLRVVLIGGGGQKSELEKQAKTLGIADRVSFMGKIPFTDVPAYLKAADIFGFASLTETQGLVTMEAMAAGLPIAAVDAPGTRDELEHDRHGLLTPNDPEKLGEAIDLLLSEPARSEQYRLAAREKAQFFDINHQAQKLVELYEVAREDHQAGRRVEMEYKGLVERWTDKVTSQIKLPERPLVWPPKFD
jgi:glycosyltransferase involved in cell wall biosynthesis